MSFFIILIMAALTALAVVMVMKKNSVGAAVCAVLVVVLAIGRLFSGSDSGQAVESNIQKVREVMTDGVAEKVEERHPGSKVVILGNPDTAATHRLAVEARETDALLAKALSKRGLEVESLPFSSKLAITDPAQLKQGQLSPDQVPPEWAPEFDYDQGADSGMALHMDTANAAAGPFVKVLRSLNGKADVVVLNLPLSAAMDPQDLPAKGEAPHLVLMYAPEWSDLHMPMKSTVLDMVLIYRPNISDLVFENLPRNKAKAFDQGFFLATPENPVPQS